MSYEKLNIDTPSIVSPANIGVSSVREGLPPKQPFPFLVDSGDDKPNVVEITSLSQRQALTKNNLVVVIDYYTKWCVQIGRAHV